MDIEYTPVEVDSGGMMVIEAKCGDVKAKRSPGSKGGRGAGQKDAVQNFGGKTFQFTISPTGQMVDGSQLKALIGEVGQTAFRKKSSQGRVKELDMIGDFITSQWFLWDSISSVKRPTKGVAVGESWESVLPVPLPMVIRKARKVSYNLAEVRESDSGRIAVIKSSFSPAESFPSGWPIPYSGSFKMSGSFGLIRGYEILELAGKGEELFNLDAGLVEKREQHYEIEMSAIMPMIGTEMKITIQQELSMTLLED